MKRELAEKYGILKKKIESYIPRGIVVAFSGGVDSALLLKAACMAAGGESVVYAITVQTKLHPAGDLESARVAALTAGAVHKVLQMDELAEAGIETNPVNRCYLCKKGIFQKIKKAAAKLGAGCIMEGTNGDDLFLYRPGIQALRELGIVSPLADCGLTKAEVRELAQHLGILAANRPSAPCLATRLPYGTKISYELLAKIDEAEQFLRALGFYNVRLRVHKLIETVGEGGKESWLARIEVDREDIPKLFACGKEVTEKVKQLGFSRVTVDLEGFRSGSMDEQVEKKAQLCIRTKKMAECCQEPSQSS